MVAIMSRRSGAACALFLLLSLSGFESQAQADRVPGRRISVLLTSVWVMHRCSLLAPCGTLDMQCVALSASPRGRLGTVRVVGLDHEVSECFKMRVPQSFEEDGNQGLCGFYLELFPCDHLHFAF